MDASGSELRGALLARFRDGADAPFTDDDFNRLALGVFAHNFRAVPAYRAYCTARDRTPETVERWTDIPAVPTAAFKELPLRDESAVAEHVFRTSGTTRGAERRGEHHVVDLELYRASLRPTFRAFLLPDGARPRMVSLMPPADQLPDSSLAFMITDVMAVFGADGSAAFAGPDGLDHAGLDRAAAGAVEAREPILLLGTSSAFIHWLDHLAGTDRRFVLPAGSRLMDTGGFKGRGRNVEPGELRAEYGRRLGLPDWACVNEYGMTELLSQYYDDALRRHHGNPSGRAEAVGRAVAFAEAEAVARAPRRKAGPGWLRSVAVDPETLEPLPDGETGLLRHVDLANLYGVAAVQTEDQGRVTRNGLEVDGRAAGAPARGCSIAMDLLLEGAP